MAHFATVYLITAEAHFCEPPAQKEYNNREGKAKAVHYFTPVHFIRRFIEAKRKISGLY